MLGLSFSETLKGFIALGPSAPEPPGAGPLPGGVASYLAAEREAQHAGATAEFAVTITLDDLDAFLADPARPAAVAGTVRVTGLTAPDGAAIVGGSFNLFIRTDAFYDRRMLYALPFVGADGALYSLDGFKDVKDDGRFDVWAATSTLYVTVRRPDGSAVGTGVLHIHLADFLTQLTTFRALGTDDPVAQASAIARFGAAFLGTLWDVFGRPRLEG